MTAAPASDAFEPSLAGYTSLYGVASDEVVERLAGAGYDCAVFHPESSQLEYTTPPWLLGAQNVLAISRQHASQVRQRLTHSATGHHD